MKRVAVVGSLFGERKNAHKSFRLARIYYFCIAFASLLSVIVNLQIQFSLIYNIYHVIVYFLPKKYYFDLNKHFFVEGFQKSA